MKLYIIGNGFDLNHGMETSYKAYRRFLEHSAPHTLRDFEGFANIDAFNCDEETRWTSLEQLLTIDYEPYMSDIADNFYPLMTSERTPGWDDIKIEVDNTLSFLHFFTRVDFYNWIESVEIPDPEDVCLRQDVDPKGFFITFNYTKTLEALYDIPEEQILHIHGDTDDPSSIQFGTPENNPENVSSRLEKLYSNDDFYSVTFAPAINSLAGFVAAAYKNIEANFASLQSFLGKCGSIDEVVIMGHSLLGIDDQYYSDILVPRFSNARWIIFIHSQNDEDSANAFIASYGLKNVQLVKW